MDGMGDIPQTNMTTRAPAVPIKSEFENMKLHQMNEFPGSVL